MNKAESKEQAIRKLQPGKLVIASHNAGKVREIRKLLGPFGIKPVSAAELGLPEPEETGTSFLAHAELKALTSAELSGLTALSDDRALGVCAFRKQPAIYRHDSAVPYRDLGTPKPTCSST